MRKATETDPSTRPSIDFCPRQMFIFLLFPLISLEGKLGHKEVIKKSNFLEQKEMQKIQHCIAVCLPNVENIDYRKQLSCEKMFYEHVGSQFKIVH